MEVKAIIINGARNIGTIVGCLSLGGLLAFGVHDHFVNKPKFYETSKRVEKLVDRDGNKWLSLVELAEVYRRAGIEVEQYSIERRKTQLPYLGLDDLQRVIDSYSSD